MKKNLTKEFNFELFKSGKLAQTKLGNPVKFICITGDKMLINIKHRYNIIGGSTKILAPSLSGRNEKYNLNGKKYNGYNSEYDLEMVDFYEV